MCTVKVKRWCSGTMKIRTGQWTKIAQIEVSENVEPASGLNRIIFENKLRLVHVSLLSACWNRFLNWKMFKYMFKPVKVSVWIFLSWNCPLLYGHLWKIFDELFFWLFSGWRYLWAATFPWNMGQRGWESWYREHWRAVSRAFIVYWTHPFFPVPKLAEL